MNKTDKELAVELLGNYLHNIIDPEDITAKRMKEILGAFYEAIHTLSDESVSSNHDDLDPDEPEDM